MVGGREMEWHMIQTTNALFSQTTPLNLVSLLLQGQQDLCWELCHPQEDSRTAQHNKHHLKLRQYQVVKIENSWKDIGKHTEFPNDPKSEPGMVTETCGYVQIYMPKLT